MAAKNAAEPEVKPVKQDSKPEPDWDSIARGLLQPFPPCDVEFRSLRFVKGRNGQPDSHEVAAYITKPAAIARLDEIVGLQNWSYDFTPLVQDVVEQKVTVFDERENKNVQVLKPIKEMTRAKGTLTIHGVSKSALGDSSNTNPSKGCDSDAFKRAAVMWGLGRYLYDLPKLYVPANEVYYSRISDRALAELRSKLPAPEGYQAPQQQGNQQAPQGEQRHQSVPAQRSNGNGGGDAARVAAIADYAAAVSEKQLPTGEDWRDWETFCVAAFLKIPQQDAVLEKMTTAQIKNATGAIRAGKLFWPLPDNES